METIFSTQNIKIMSNTLSQSKKKERNETILEPLQAILQLALLSFCPIGTKISVHKNLLCLQQPYYTQGLVRWYNNDNKDDLFYLFYVCKRFPIFYSHLKDVKFDKTNFFDLIISLAKKGLHKLAETYCKSDKISLLHTLEIYKALLDNPEMIPLCNENEKKDIETIFIKITDLYNKQTITFIFCALMQLDNDTKNYNDYINGLNTFLNPITQNISNWINNNLFF
jgi:hypothetical protein